MPPNWFPPSECVFKIFETIMLNTSRNRQILDIMDLRMDHRTSKQTGMHMRVPRTGHRQATGFPAHVLATAHSRQKSLGR